MARAALTRQVAYLSVADALAARWAGLPPGTLVDSEHQIADEFGINRLTAREALRELERRLVVRREVGRGTFTAFRLDYPVQLGGIASFHRNVAAAGHAVSNVSTDVWWEPLAGRERQLMVRRVLAVDGFVASVGSERFVPAVGARVEPLVGDGSSIHDALESLGYRPRRRSVQVSVEMAPPDDAERLGFAGSAPPSWHLRSETVDVAAAGEPVIHRSEGWMRTDMFAVTVTVGPVAE